MNTSTIGYWAATVLFSLALGMSGLAYLAGAAPIREALVDGLGYPVYFMPILGTWKLLGAIALLTPPSAPIPYLARIKDWAYAGFFFNLTGAAASHLLNGDGIGHVVPILVFGALCATSFALRPDAARISEGKPALA